MTYLSESSHRGSPCGSVSMDCANRGSEAARTECLYDDFNVVAGVYRSVRRIGAIDQCRRECVGIDARELSAEVDDKRVLDCSDCHGRQSLSCVDSRSMLARQSLAVPGHHLPRDPEIEREHRRSHEDAISA